MKNQDALTEVRKYLAAKARVQTKAGKRAAQLREQLNSVDVQAELSIAALTDALSPDARAVLTALGGEAAE